MLQQCKDGTYVATAQRLLWPAAPRYPVQDRDHPTYEEVFEAATSWKGPPGEVHFVRISRGLFTPRRV